MYERGDGRIINVSSGAGRLDQDPDRHGHRVAEAAAVFGEARFGQSGQGLGASLLAYGTSKAALNRFTVGLAQGVQGLGVGVNAIEVGAR